MRQIFLIFVTALIARSALALPKDDLRQALATIDANVEIPDETRTGTLRTAGDIAMTWGLVGSSLIAWPIMRDQALSARRIKVFKLAYNAAFGGAVILTFTSLYRVWAQYYAAQSPADYHGPAGLQRFFQLSLDQQYEVASRDAAFSAFLIDFARSYNTLSRGYQDSAAPSMP